MGSEGVLTPSLLTDTSSGGIRMALVQVDQCPTCKRFRGERHKATRKRPSVATLERYVSNGIAKATDGCSVEPDGECMHGHSSWLMRLGYI